MSFKAICKRKQSCCLNKQCDKLNTSGLKEFQTDYFKIKINKFLTNEKFYKTYGVFGRREIKTKSFEVGNAGKTVNYAKIAGKRREQLHKKSKLASLINPSHSTINFSIDCGSKLSRNQLTINRI